MLVNNRLSAACYRTQTLASNLAKSPKNQRITAMAAGMSQTLWSMDDIAALLDANQQLKKRGPYKKRTAEISN